MHAPMAIVPLGVRGCWSAALSQSICLRESRALTTCRSGTHSKSRTNTLTLVCTSSSVERCIFKTNARVRLERKRLMDGKKDRTNERGVYRDETRYVPIEYGAINFCRQKRSLSVELRAWTKIRSPGVRMSGRATVIAGQVGSNNVVLCNSWAMQIG